MVDIGSGSYASGVGDHAIVTVPQLVDMYAQSNLYADLQNQIPELIKADATRSPLPPPPVVTNSSMWDRVKQVWIDYVLVQKILSVHRNFIKLKFYAIVCI
jgi:hypothetical protein